jgi:hypothetical protein
MVLDFIVRHQVWEMKKRVMMAELSWRQGCADHDEEKRKAV